jgi:hypothetical protein
MSALGHKRPFRVAVKTVGARLWKVPHSVEQMSHWRIIDLPRTVIEGTRCHEHFRLHRDWRAGSVLVWAVADHFTRGKL